MKREDTIDIGRGVKLRNKTVSQLLNRYGMFYAELDRVESKEEEELVLEALGGVYTEVHKRVDPELLNQG